MTRRRKRGASPPRHGGGVPKTPPARTNQAQQEATGAVGASDLPAGAGSLLAAYDALRNPDADHHNGHHGDHRGDQQTAEVIADQAAPVNALDLLAFDADDNGNAEAMRLLYGERFIYNPAFGWLGWTGTHWQADADAVVTLAAIETLKRRRHAAVDAQREDIVKAAVPNDHRIRACATNFRAYVTEVDATTFDNDPDLLNCHNGVLNLPTGAIAQHCPRQRSTYW